VFEGHNEVGCRRVDVLAPNPTLAFVASPKGRLVPWLVGASTSPRYHYDPATAAIQGKAQHRHLSIEPVCERT